MDLNFLSTNELVVKDDSEVVLCGSPFAIKGTVALLVSPLSYSAGKLNFSHPWENHRRGKTLPARSIQRTYGGLGPYDERWAIMGQKVFLKGKGD